MSQVARAAPARDAPASPAAVIFAEWASEDVKTSCQNDMPEEGADSGSIVGQLGTHECLMSLRFA